jgi:chemotaxis protein CheX
VKGAEHMDAKCITPFLDGVKYTLEQFGVIDIKRGSIEKKDTLKLGFKISSIIGIKGVINGNVAYSMTEDTAKKAISAMMMGMPVDSIDEIGKSAIGELSNMITGHASMGLAENGYNVNITPPAISMESNSIISHLETIAIILETSIGKIEVNIGLET